jgi:hypothetical protein
VSLDDGRLVSKRDYPRRGYIEFYSGGLSWEYRQSDNVAHLTLRRNKDFKAPWGEVIIETQFVCNIQYLDNLNMLVSTLPGSIKRTHDVESVKINYANPPYFELELSHLEWLLSSAVSPDQTFTALVYGTARRDLEKLAQPEAEWEIAIWDLWSLHGLFATMAEKEMRVERERAALAEKEKAEELLRQQLHRAEFQASLMAEGKCLWCYKRLGFIDKLKKRSYHARCASKAKQ